MATVLAWIVITLLGVASVFLLVRHPLFGMLGTAMTLFLATVQFVTLPATAIWLFWGFWVIFLVIAVWRVAKIRTAGQFAAWTLPPFSFAALTIVVGTVVGVGVVGPALALPLPGGGVQNVAVVGTLPGNGTRTVDAEKECPGGTKYYAYDAEKGTNAMGPAAQADTVDAATYRFNTKRECDPLWLATVVHFLKDGDQFDPAKAAEDAKSYVADPAKRTAAKQFVTEEIVKFYLVDAGSVPYDSLGMIPGGSSGEMPQLTKFSRQPALGQSLVAEVKGGSKRYFRIECDLQASVPKEFKKVPPPEKGKEEKPPTIPPKTLTTPPSTKTTTTTPGTETTTSTPSTSTTTTTTGTTSTTTTTPPSSTTSTTTKTTTSTTTTKTTPSTSTTTTTPSTSTTTTTPPKGSVTVPSGKPPVGSPPGNPESTKPVESNPANPKTTPGQADPTMGAPGATQQPTRQPVPSVQPTGGAQPTNPHQGDVDPDNAGSSPATSSAAGLLALLLLPGAAVLGRRRLAAASRK